jgi:hypothetical protein
MDFTRPERCQRQRTGREDRRSKFYEISDNLPMAASKSKREAIEVAARPLRELLREEHDEIAAAGGARPGGGVG